MKAPKTSNKARKVTQIERNPAQQIVPMMNYYHSLESRYFATKELRDAEIRRVLSNVTTLLTESNLSPALKDAITDSLNNKKYWESIRDRLF